MPTTPPPRESALTNADGPPPRPLVASAGEPLRGSGTVPGDKSISHRALMLGALAVGETRIGGLLESEDVRATAKALGELGATVAAEADGAWRVSGVGVGGLSEPDALLDMGNAGTAARLLAGLCASHHFTTFLTGDASLRKRPMRRIIAPLERMGARFVARAGDRLPMAVIGAERAMPIEYALPVPSAQVKSAVLLAGLNTPGETSVIETEATRDHTERMLGQFGATITRSRAVEAGATRIAVMGEPELRPCALTVPGDISAAAFPIVGALIVPGSEVVLRGVGINPLRTGLIETLREMGASIDLANEREACGEPVADIAVRASTLKAVDVPGARAPSMIDEYPVLGVAAACAAGTTRLRGLAELRVKESDRLAAIAAGLKAAGVAVSVRADGLDIEGCTGPPPGGGCVRTEMDHRIAMAFLVLGLASRRPMTVDDGAMIATSFPGFVPFMREIGANIADA